MTDTGEQFRGGFHLLIGTLAFTAASWNLMTWGERGGRRHAVNAILYLTLAGYEAYNTRRHWTTAPTVTATEDDAMLGIGA
jgi:hypothetical protein